MNQAGAAVVLLRGQAEARSVQSTALSLLLCLFSLLRNYLTATQRCGKRLKIMLVNIQLSVLLERKSEMI